MPRFNPLLLPGLCLLAAIPMHAQSVDASLNGTVFDLSGKLIPDAEVLVINDTTGIHYDVKTNPSGIYFVPILPPGHYHLQVSKIGFRTIIEPDVILNVQSALSLNFTLPVGAVSESLNVQGSSSLVNTVNASVSTVIDNKFVENMPLNGRSFQDLLSMTPGVTTQSPQTSQSLGAKGDFSVNGQRTESNYYTVDGVSANSSAGAPTGGPQAATGGNLGASTSLGTTQSLISVDALQEFRVSSSSYSAEFGRSPGGQFALATRSGTNQFHGSAFDYLRNSYVDANNWFNDHYGKAITPLRQNDFGGTLGGPILPSPNNKARATYFFASYEGLRLTQPQAASVQYVPDAALRQNAPAALQPILNAFPLPSPGGIDYSSGLAQFIEPFSLPSSIDSGSGRVDQIFSSRFSAFFRFSETPSSTHSRVLSALTTTAVDNQSYTLGATKQLTNTATNEFRLGYSRSESLLSSVLDSFGGAAPVNLNTVMGNAVGATASSNFEMAFAGTGTASIATTPALNEGRQWNLVDTASVSNSRHQIKFGIDYRRIKSPLTSASPYVSGIYLNASQVTNNRAYLGILAKVLPSTPVFNEFAAFVQDEWKLLPTLTLSGGIRWELDPPPTEEHGNDAFTLNGNLSQPTSLTLAPRGTSLWKTSWYNFAPRVGAAWTAYSQPGWETVVRAGGGVFFDTGNQIAADGFQYLGFSAIEALPNIVMPVTANQLAFGPSTSPPYTNTDVVAFPKHLQLPYALEWNVAVQQALGKQQALTISYVGSNGRRLLQLLEESIHSFNPTFGDVLVAQGGVTSNDQALQVQFQRSVTRGVQALVSYTWSHSIDFGSNDTAQPVIRGNSDFDLRSNLQGGLSWDLPGFHGNAFSRAILLGWGFDGRLMSRTGFPVTLQGNLLTDSGTGSQYYGNLNVVPGQPVYLHGDAYPGGRAINRAAFQLPISGAVGDAPRNFVRGFGMTQVNLAARRTFALGSRFTLQFRAEAFNILNHPAFGLVDPTFTDALFGQSTQTLNQSLATMGAQYQQGGPRSMQFALRLRF